MLEKGKEKMMELISFEEYMLSNLAALPFKVLLLQNTPK